MARLIRIDQSGPYKIDPADFPKDGKPIWICGCGLSPQMPYCDGTHKACRTNEQPGVLYTYDMTTRQITGQQPDPRASQPPTPPQA